MDLPSNRLAALAAGVTHYFTGKPCPHGHVAKRFAKAGSCTECIRLSVRSRYAKDPEKWRAHGAKYSKARYEAKREEVAASNKAWQQRHPERVRAYKAANKAKRRAVEGIGASWVEVEAWKAGQKKLCYWCGAKCGANFHVDHYEPLAKGGAHRVDNLVISCPSCNHRKSSKDPYKFAAQVGRLF